MSSESDLTDIEEDEVPLSQTQSARKANATEGYRIRGALKVPRMASYTAQSLFDQMHGEDIDLDAEYQRDIVWPDSKQIGLVDSIFRNFYVPPVIFVVKHEDDGSEKRVCVDGKQRLTSIWRFMDGVIPYKDAFTNEKFYYKDVANRKGSGKLLPERYRKIFRNKQIVCMEYDNLTGDNEREIFQRVQLGMALTPAEKLQAINTPTASFIRELAKDYVTNGLAELLDWDTSRGSDFRGLASAVYSIHKWPSQTPATSISQLQKWIQEPESLEDSFCAKMHQTFSIFVALAKDKKLSKPFKLPGVKKVSPAEFMTSSVLISLYKDKLTLAQLSEAIGMMRKYIREQEVDIRMNTRVVKPMLAFIKDLKMSKLKPDPDSPVAAKAVGKGKRKLIDNVDESVTSKSASKSKRIKLDGEDDEDGEEEEVITKTKRLPAPPPLPLPSSRASKKSSSAQFSSVSHSQSPHSVSQSAHPPPPLSSLPPLPLPPPSQSTHPPPPFQYPSAHTYSSAPPSSHLYQSEPTMHPDRLAAIRAAKSGASSPSSAPRSHSIQSIQSDSQMLTMGIPRGPVSSSLPPLVIKHNTLEESIMARMGASQPLHAQDFPPSYSETQMVSAYPIGSRRPDSRGPPSSERRDESIYSNDAGRYSSGDWYSQDASGYRYSARH